MRHVNFRLIGLSFLLCCGIFGRAQPDQKTAKIRGFVYAEDTGEPVESILRIDALQRATGTDENGFWRFPELPAGTHIITTIAPGYHDHQDTVTLAQGQVATRKQFLMKIVELRPEDFEWDAATRESILNVKPEEINRIPTHGREDSMGTPTGLLRRKDRL